MYLKRQEVPKNWPITRKGTTYVVSPSFDFKSGVPLLILLRDFLKVVNTRSEAKKAINSKSIIVNWKNAKNDRESVRIFDTIGLIPSKKYYQLSLTKTGKFTLNEIKEDESKTKVCKIIGKKTLNSKKTQLNLSDGRNVISGIKCRTQDSVLVNLKDRKISKCLPLAERAKIIVFAGKHSGKTGIINKIDLDKKIVEMKSDDGLFNVLIKQFMVIEN